MSAPIFYIDDVEPLYGKPNVTDDNVDLLLSQKYPDIYSDVQGIKTGTVGQNLEDASSHDKVVLYTSVALLALVVIAGAWWGYKEYKDEKYKKGL